MGSKVGLASANHTKIFLYSFFIAEVLLTRQSETCTFGSNFIRNVHTVPKLSWDQSINDRNEDWAIRCALKKTMEFSDEGYGENLFWGIGKTMSCENPLFSWYR